MKVVALGLAMPAVAYLLVWAWCQWCQMLSLVLMPREHDLERRKTCLRGRCEPAMVVTACSRRWLSNWRGCKPWRNVHACSVTCDGEMPLISVHMLLLLRLSPPLCLHDDACATWQSLGLWFGCRLCHPVRDLREPSTPSSQPLGPRWAGISGTSSRSTTQQPHRWSGNRTHHNAISSNVFDGACPGFFELKLAVTGSQACRVLSA